MAKNQESINRSLFELLRSRGYAPTLLDTSGKEIPVPEEAEVFQFKFTKDGEEYGTVTASIDGLHKLIIYFGDDVANSEKEDNGGDDSWYKLLNHLKRFSQQHQLSFEVKNRDHLKYDMAKREHMKKQERISEGYYPMGKKASYNDNIPTVKIVIEHSRQIEEGEQRYRNVNRIFLENTQGERILAPTTKPGVAQIYARHLAEGGLPHDDRWNHIVGLCEEYNKMGAFVRATRNNQFNESAQQLVNEGINHYQSLKESLSKMRGSRGYNSYFESYTPPLMEDEAEENNLNELFVQETLDPRIESVMPILSKLHKKVAEMKEVDALAEWADSLLEAPGAETLKHNDDTEKSNLKAFDLAEDDDLQEPAIDELDESDTQSSNSGGIPEEVEEGFGDAIKKGLKKLDKIVTGGDKEDLIRDLQQKAGVKVTGKKPEFDAKAKSLARSNPSDPVGNFAKGGKDLGIFKEEEVEESALQAYLGNKKYGKDGMDALRKAGQDHSSEKEMQNIRAKFSNKEKEVEEGTTVKTKTGIKHHGDYGTEFQPDDTRDEYGHRTSGAPHVAGAKQRGNTGAGRGRPTHDEKLSTDDLPADAFNRTSGKIPKGKEGKVHTVGEEIDTGEYDARKSTSKGEPSADWDKNFREKVKQYAKELEQRQKEKPEQVDEDEFAGDYATGEAGQWRNKGPKAHKPATIGDLVGEGQEDLNALKRLLGK